MPLSEGRIGFALTFGLRSRFSGTHPQAMIVPSDSTAKLWFLPADTERTLASRGIGCWSGGPPLPAGGGSDYSAALLADGTVMTWGNNIVGHGARPCRNGIDPVAALGHRPRADAAQDHGTEVPANVRMKLTPHTSGW